MDTRQNSFRPLTLSTLKPQTGYIRPYFSTPSLVTVMDCALEVMTDLNFVPAAVVQDELDIESATQKMIARGVRSLLVTDSHHDVIGIVTSRDLIGDRPHQVMDRLVIPFAEVKVSHIMTAAADIEVMPLQDVLHARVGDIVMTLKHSGRQHALVVEETEFGEKPMIRGIFSASQIARQLGIALQQHELAQTFAEIDRAIQGAA
jgi:CBS-domain-containing membrane protein